MFLKNKKTISDLFANGRKKYQKHPFRILILEAKGEPGYVVAVSKKLFKNAVDRNRIKRLIRAALVGKTPQKSIAIVYVDRNMPDKKLIEQISESV